MKTFGDGRGVDEIALADLAHDELIHVPEENLFFVFHFRARVCVEDLRFRLNNKYGTICTQQEIIRPPLLHWSTTHPK